jgi:hypothetical protein
MEQRGVSLPTLWFIPLGSSPRERLEQWTKYQEARNIYFYFHQKTERECLAHSNLASISFILIFIYFSGQTDVYTYSLNLHFFNSEFEHVFTISDSAM